MLKKAWFNYYIIMVYDCIIIGMGPAGLSAAIYLSRANKKVLVIGDYNKIWNKDVVINNYFGTGQVRGDELMEKGLSQAKGFGAEIILGLATKASINEKGLFIITAEGKEFIGKKLIIATGSAAVKKEIVNQEDFIGRGVSFCVPCDGFFFKDKKVGVIGSQDYALSEAIELLNYSKDVTLLSNGKDLLFDKKLLEKNGIRFDGSKIERIIGDKKVAAIKTLNGEKAFDGLFIASGSADSNDLARMLGVIVEDGKIIVDSSMKTNIPGVYAAGDCTKGIGQIATAVSKGAIAGMAATKEV